MQVAHPCPLHGSFFHSQYLVIEARWIFSILMSSSSRCILMGRATASIRSDNGPEFVALAVRDRTAAVGAKTA